MNMQVIAGLVSVCVWIINIFMYIFSLHDNSYLLE